MNTDFNLSRIEQAQAFQSMAFDILGRVLSDAHDPGEVGSYLVEQMRELTGARTVVLAQPHREGEGNEYRVHSVHPERKRSMAESEPVAQLAEIVRAWKKPKLLSEDTGWGEAGEILAALGYRMTIGVPLNIGDDCVGVLLLLDIPDTHGISQILELLEVLSTVTTLVFRNAILYEQSAERAEKLQEANEELQRKIIEGKLREDKLRAVTASRDELDRAKVELERSNKELEQFAYVASHDLQEPLRMVISFTQLLAKRYEGRLDENADKYIAYAVDGASRMQQLINDLLTFSRVTSRAVPPESVNCGKVLDDTLDGLASSIEDTGARVTHDPLPIVRADPTQLGQLLQNLIGNAIKYVDKVTPEVHVSATRDGSVWCFAVRDNGIGIEPQHAERIFDIFQRLHPKTEYSGTGIGLAVCKKIVERYGGRIWVDSEAGKGSVFRFTLPDSIEEG